MKRPLSRWIPMSLLIVGLLQMFGDLTGLRAVKAIGAATTLSPAPKVFSSVEGMETFSIGISLHWTDQENQVKTLPLTPEVAGQLKGPYNRRNVFGAALAYGPVLRRNEIGREMFQAVMDYALGPEKKLLAELGVDPKTVKGPVSILWQPKHGGEEFELSFQTGGTTP